MRRSGLIVMLGLLGGGACAADYHAFDDPHLVAGKAIWLANCEGCHGYGVAGAPIPTRPDEWRARVQQPQALLYQHALEGFFGPGDTMMPARGGNDQLTDDEVRAAVDYMTALARFHIQHED